MRALVPEFTRLVFEFAPRFDARPIAPATLADLLALDRAAPLPVWEGASDYTIHGDARANHAFRAWHDAAHIATHGRFTLAGERDVCERQKRDILERYPRAPRLWLDLLDAEINGQADYFAAHGEFPADQVSFVRERLAL